MAAALAACASAPPRTPQIEHRGAAPPARITSSAAEPQSSGSAAAAPASAASNGPAVQLPERPSSIVVQPGDTLFSLGERYMLTVDAIAEANNMSRPYRLLAGTRLRLPSWPTYTVRSGDTVSEIAEKARVDMPSLLLLNYIPDPDRLRVGQVLILPELPGGGLEPPAPAPATSRPSSGGRTAPAGAAPQPEAPTSMSQATGTGGQFSWPITGDIISTFGPKSRGTRNDGVNIQARAGAQVRAAADGTVEYAGNELPGYGELLLVKHPGGWVTVYAHNRRLLVDKDAAVKKGDVIAEVGQTGSVNSPQLHFELRRGVDPVDPMQHLPPA